MRVRKITCRGFMHMYWLQFQFMCVHVDLHFVLYSNMLKGLGGVYTLFPNCGQRKGKLNAA